MTDEDILHLLIMSGMILIIVIAAIALEAGNIVSQLLSPIPSVAGPLGAAVALFVFVFLAGKAASLVLNR